MATAWTEVLLPSCPSASCLWSSALETSQASLLCPSAVSLSFPKHLHPLSCCPALSFSLTDTDWWNKEKGINISWDQAKSAVLVISLSCTKIEGMVILTGQQQTRCLPSVWLCSLFLLHFHQQKKAGSQEYLCKFWGTLLSSKSYTLYAHF